jgi:predicted house-cleaning noncanonical NTP pyrophosphatase (MazG superfamily)
MKEPEVRKYRFKIDKLIRDKIPEIMIMQGQNAVVRRMEREEYVERLRDKLLEESQEVVEAKTADELCEELADVLEVIRSLSAACGLTVDDVEKTRVAKLAKKGGFQGRVYAEHVDIDDSSPMLAYYRANSSAYPEIVG